MKKTISSLMILCSFLLIASLHAQTPQIKWWFDTKDASFGQSAAGDIDHDGKLEIVFGCYRNDSCVYALNGEDGSLLWKYNTHTAYEGCNDVAPVIYDIDNDDSLEVIVPSSCNPKTFCFNGKTGAVKWQTNTRGSDSPPTIADIDNDSKPEILHGEFGGYVMCLNGEDGSISWEIPVDTNSWIQTAPTIVDVDNNGILDFVVGTWNNVNKPDNKVYAYRGDTHALLWSYPIGDFMYHGTAVADLDKDSYLELVIGSYNDTLYCINAENGSTKWKYRQSASYYMGAPAAIADLNKDGWCEVVFVSWYVVGALSHDGALLWSYNTPNYEQAFRGVALADITNDDTLDVVFGTDGGNVYALNGSDGGHLWTKDLATHYGNTLFKFDNAPLVADFNNDDTLEVFIVGGHAEYPAFSNDFGRAYMISAGKGTGPDWLMFQRDIRRMSSFCMDSVQAVNEINPAGNDAVSVFPNPSSDKIQVNSEKLKIKSIAIYNIQGQQMMRTQYQNKNTIELDVSALAKGIYIVKVQTENNIVNKKLIIQ